jgi:hypothetical protein
MSSSHQYGATVVAGEHIAAAETTRIPVDARAGHHGAIAYFAVLCYPGIDPRSHHRRNQFTTALLRNITESKSASRAAAEFALHRAIF